ncbi:Gfo/Idh/MocA family oxidoreductase, partial [Streptosporangium sp. NPDC003464]
MRVGLLGLGRIGAFHAATLAALVDELVVSDADRSRAEAVAGQLGARVGDAFDADAVVIATPTAGHAELLLRACELGVPA